MLELNSFNYSLLNKEWMLCIRIGTLMSEMQDLENRISEEIKHALRLSNTVKTISDSLMNWRRKKRLAIILEILLIIIKFEKL